MAVEALCVRQAYLCTKVSHTHTHICTATQYNMTVEGLREKFEQYGEIKTFFSLIENRGMLFVTYVSVSNPKNDKTT
jgi:hypothetical protein